MLDSVSPRRPLDREQIDRRLARIRELLARWAELGSGDGQGRRVLRPWDESAVAAFEGRHGVRLPENYRRYLLEFGDPADMLMSYAPQEPDEQAGPRSGEPFPLDRPWAGHEFEIDAWEEEEDGDFFEDGPGEFYAQFDDPAEAFYDLPAGAKASDGTLKLGATRSHFIARLVLDGPWAGTVWIDSTGYDGGLIAPADDSMDGYTDQRLNEFIDASRWSPLADQPWFPPPGDPLGDPSPADFLDLTLDCLRQQVRLAEAERACDRLDVPTLTGLHRRLAKPHEFGFPRGHRYGGFGNYIDGLLRDELLRPVPDPAASDRIVELTKAVLPVAYLPTALIAAGRWKELVDLELHGFPRESRSVVNLVLATVMLATGPETVDTDLPTDLVGSGNAADRPGLHRWAVLSTLTRMTAGRREQFWARIPAAEAAELRPALRTATLPVTAAALDALLADTVTTLDRDGATLLLTRALHTPPREHSRPDTALVDRICALAAATERMGDVFEPLDRMAGGRWADWRAAEHAGRQWLALHRGRALGRTS